MPSTAHTSSRPAAVRRRRTLCALSRIDEALELTLGHAIAELCAPRAEATQLSLAQPPPHRFGGRPQSFGHLAHREQTLFVHRGPGAAFRRVPPRSAEAARDSVEETPCSCEKSSVHPTR